jgi:presenilin-like A22 family membrane protease
MKRSTVDLTRTQIVGFAVLAAFVGGILALLGQMVIAKSIAPTPDGTQVVAGTKKHYDGSPGDLAYECTPDYTAIEVAIGETKEASGAFVSLSEVRNESGHQESVTFTAKLGDSVEMPSIIVNSAAHTKLPELYGNTKLAPKMGPGGTTQQTLLTAAYVRNFVSEGITTVVFCTKQRATQQ